MSNLTVNSDSYFAVKHSESISRSKEGALLLTGALAMIALIGGVLGALAFNGVHFGVLNSITTTISAQYPLFFLAGISLLTIDMVLIAALAYGYKNKQYTQKQINRFGLEDWLAGNHISGKLEPGQYWNFPSFSEQPVLAIKSNPGRPAVWGFVTKNSENDFSVYAFKTQHNKSREIEKIGYKNGEACATYTIPYLHSQTKETEKLTIQEWEAKPLRNGEYRSLEISTEAMGTVYGIKYRKNETLYTDYFKSKEARDPVQAGLIDRDEIENVIQQDVKYLPQGSFWMTSTTQEFPIYIVTSKGFEADNATDVYFHSLDEANTYIQTLGDQAYQDARQIWDDSLFFPKDWVKENFNQDGLRSGLLQKGQVTYCDFNNIIDGVEYIVYALKVVEFDCQSSHDVYFKSNDVRERFITQSLSDYTIIQAFQGA